MSTARVTLDTTQYVRVNIGYTSMILQAHRDDVRVVINDVKPAKSNTAFMLLSGDDSPLKLDTVDGNVWALATSQHASLIVTEAADHLQVRQGAGDLINDAWGVPKVSLPNSLFHGMWTFDISPKMWFMYENGTQVYTSTNIVSANGHAVLTADVTNTTVKMESRECPRYQANRGHLFSWAGWLPNKTADAVREWGGQTADNGVFFRLKSDGLLYAVLKSGGVERFEEVIDTSVVPNFDVATGGGEFGNVYDCQYQWRGVGNYVFFINLVEVHAMELLGKYDVISIENPALPYCAKVTRITEDAVMHIGCADITSENGNDDKQFYTSAYTIGYSGTGADWPVLVIHNPLQINGVTNTRTVHLKRITVNATKKCTFKVWTTRDPTAFNAAMVLKAIGDGSFVECDSTDVDGTATRAATATANKMKLIMPIFAEANVRTPTDNPDTKRLVFNMVRGDYLVITCSDAQATADVVVELGEEI